MSNAPKSVRVYRAKQQKEWRDRKRAAGLVDVTVWVPSTMKEKLLKYAEKLRTEAEKK